MSRHAWVSMSIVAVLGAVIASGCATSRPKDKDVSIDQVPFAVKTAIENETRGGTVNEIEKKHWDGKPGYEVEYTKDGRTVEVKFADDGTIMTPDKDGDND